MGNFNPAAVWLWIVAHKTVILALLPFVIVIFFLRVINPR